MYTKLTSLILLVNRKKTLDYVAVSKKWRRPAVLTSHALRSGCRTTYQSVACSVAASSTSSAGGTTVAAVE